VTEGSVDGGQGACSREYSMQSQNSNPDATAAVCHGIVLSV
jgi:uncharacterized membrane protein YgaE (UPF0421/DUF939 family)